MLPAAQFLLMLLYALLPVLTLAWALLAAYRHRRLDLLVSFATTCLAAFIACTAFIVLNGFIMGGPTPIPQGLRFVYLLIAVICLLKLLDRLLLRAFFHAARVPLDLHRRPLAPYRARACAVLILQRALMLAIILSYAASLIITYRPRVLLRALPPSRFDLSPSLAHFPTRDGFLLTAWWIPVTANPPDTDPDIAPQWATRTVILCHGLASGKENLLPLASFLHERGFNVLLFDFRAHGQSDGNFITYGDRERLDVLAAAHWVKANHPDRAQRLFGVGINTGAAALIAAAADPADGRVIDALVLCEPYARFKTLAQTIADDTLPLPVAWLVRNISLPLASLHTGHHLNAFAPQDFALDLWPRPVLIIHARSVTCIPVDQQMDLYREIPQPKEQFWPAENLPAARDRLRRAAGDTAMLTEMLRQWLGTSTMITDDPGVRDVTLRFLRDAQPTPVI